MMPLKDRHNKPSGPSPLITIVGNLGGPFILRPSEGVQALPVFPNAIVAAAFIKTTGFDNLVHGPIDAPSFCHWLKQIEESGITHVSVVPHRQTELNLVPIKQAIFIAGVSGRW